MCGFGWLRFVFSSAMERVCVGLRPQWQFHRKLLFLGEDAMFLPHPASTRRAVNILIFLNVGTMWRSEDCVITHITRLLF